MIENGSKVTIHYKLTVEGTMVDSSEDRGPLTYTQGENQIVPGLEEHLSGLEAGVKTSVVVPPEKGYGVRNPEAVQAIPKGAFEDVGKIAEGMVIQGDAGQGQRFSAVVSEISESSVTLDMNHPLAGKTLEFEVEVVNVA
ncbi:MAG: peptidylprolyl isomerase [Acidobacteriota bacterium]|nr:MAG: peptidylprolyl isomerase [Acidobacteriota bacterium]